MTDSWSLPGRFEGAETRKPRYFQTRTAAADFAKVVNCWKAKPAAPQFGGEIKIEQTDTGMIALLRSYGILNASQFSEILPVTNAPTQ